MRHFDHRPLSFDSLAMARYARAPLLATKAVIPAEAEQTPRKIAHPITYPLNSILAYSIKPHHEGLSYWCHRLHWVSPDSYFTLCRTRPQRVSSF